ncbi:MAG: GtrA family protein [Gammaproteobacteria bacterium]
MWVRLWNAPVARFITVGITNTALSYAVFVLAFSLLDAYAYRAGFAQMASYGLGSLWSFYWNRGWTFGAEGRVLRQALRFTFVQGLLLMASSTLMTVTVDIWNWPAGPTWITVMAFITVLNYLSLKYWVF